MGSPRTGRSGGKLAGRCGSHPRRGIPGRLTGTAGRGGQFSCARQRAAPSGASRVFRRAEDPGAGAIGSPCAGGKTGSPRTGRSGGRTGGRLRPEIGREGGSGVYIQTQGLVLRETNYKEADKILTVLTREGGEADGEGPGLPAKEQSPGAFGPAAGVVGYDPLRLPGPAHPQRGRATGDVLGGAAGTWRSWPCAPTSPRSPRRWPREGRPDQALLSPDPQLHVRPWTSWTSRWLW